MRATFCSNGVGTAQLEAPVSKSPDRGVIRRAGVQRRWPLRVLGPVLATNYDDGLPVALSVIDSRATPLGRPSSATEADFRPKLSPISESRAARVIEGCFPSIGRNPFATCPHAAGMSRLPQHDAFGQSSPVQSTTSPTVSWHFEGQGGKMEPVAPGMSAM